MTDHTRAMRRAAQTLLAAASVLLAALLIWQCASIYFAGTAPENMPQPGVYIRPVYSREIVAQRLGQIGWGFALWIAALIAALACQGKTPKQTEQGETATTGAKKRMPEPLKTPKRALAWRAALYAAAAALVIAGVLNGGARDVLVKAAQICTECIGLG